jgi:hypothetical protein
MRKPEHLAGVPSPLEQGCAQPNAVPIRPPGGGWITDAMVEITRRHWSPRYGYELSDAECVEILMNVKRVAQVLMRIGSKRP